MTKGRAAESGFDSGSVISIDSKLRLRPQVRRVREIPGLCEYLMVEETRPFIQQWAYATAYGP